MPPLISHVAMYSACHTCHAPFCLSPEPSTPGGDIELQRYGAILICSEKPSILCMYHEGGSFSCFMGIRLGVYSVVNQPPIKPTLQNTDIIFYPSSLLNPQHLGHIVSVTVPHALFVYSLHLNGGQRPARRPYPLRGQCLN
jgi:hypothetical protein